MSQGSSSAMRLMGWSATSAPCSRSAATRTRGGRPNHLEMAGDVIENAGNVLTDLAHLGAADGAVAVRFMDDVARRKMSGNALRSDFFRSDND
jgi:hypothetical protein